ncbi:formylglycine-generating enzyme family protein, partial [Myxococcota bacterium]|nr:formylglycine-generating enzyme family protein [Myxococcota bacterium]
RREAAGSALALVAALAVGLALGDLAQLAWDAAARALASQLTVLPPGGADREARFTLGLPLDPTAPTTALPSPEAGPPAPPPPGLARRQAEAPAPPAPAPGEEEEAGDTGEGLAELAFPPEAEAPPAPPAGAAGDTGGPPPEGDGAGPVDRLASRAGKGPTAQLPRLSLPGGGGGLGYLALPDRAPMAFHAIGAPPAGRDDQGGLQVARTEVTQRQWSALMGMDLGSTSGHWEHPAEALSWCDALRFANALSQREGFRPAYRVGRDCEGGGEVRWDTQANGFRLLSEAEWLALAEVSGPPPLPPPAPQRGESNNRGVGLVDAGRTDREYALAGVADNAREWVWGGLPGDGAERTQVRDGLHPRVVVRGCGSFAEVQPTDQEPWCRADHDGAYEPLGVGLRLARGRLPDAT